MAVQSFTQLGMKAKLLYSYSHKFSNSSKYSDRNEIKAKKSKFKEKNSFEIDSKTFKFEVNKVFYSKRKILINYIEQF